MLNQEYTLHAVHLVVQKSALIIVSCLDMELEIVKMTNAFVAAIALVMANALVNNFSIYSEHLFSTA